MSNNPSATQLGQTVPWVLMADTPDGFEYRVLFTVGESVHGDRAGIAHRLQGKRYAALVDLACARFAATGIVSNLHFADPRQTGRYPPDQVTLSDLGVIEVQVDAQLRVVDDRDERPNGLGCARAFSNYVCKPVHLMTCINAISRQACGKVMYVP